MNCKFLIFLIVIFIGFTPLRADYKDYYIIKYKGIELENSDTIICNNYNLQKEDKEGNFFYYYEADINLINLSGEIMLNYSEIEFLDCPSYEEWEKDKTAWGTSNICYYGGSPDETIGNCFSDHGIIDVLGNGFQDNYNN